MVHSKEKVALVTGGTAGIGRGIAEALIGMGISVVVSGRDKERGESVAKELCASGRAVYMPVDMTDKNQVERNIDDIISIHGRLDILVNNAGGASGFAPVHQLTDESWDQALVLNITSVFWACRRVLPSMIKNNFGRIINIGSMQGKQVNSSNSSHYVTVKHALNGFSKAVAHEYGRAGITSNVICVGAVETDLMRQAGPGAAEAAGMTYEEYKQRYAQQTKTGELTKVEEVAAMAALLASESGAGITGAILNVDGGTCPY